MTPPTLTHEREITAPVDLCLPDGRLNRAAVGWSRAPLHRANLTGGLGRWGRQKRWEYWGIVSPDVAVGITASSLDYAGVHAVYVLEQPGTETVASALVPLARGVVFPDTSGGGPVRVVTGALTIDLEPDDAGVRLRARTDRVEVDVRASRPTGHESVGVVVPWSDSRFQYTVKDVALPASGHVVVDGRRHELAEDESWAVLDHGRGLWPYRMTWNWGAGSGRLPDGRVVGIQVGGQWTDGTGSTENAIVVDGRLHKVGEELRWAYDSSDWLAPWHVTALRTGRVDLVLEPYHDRVDRTELGVLGNRTHQCFGHWTGTVVLDDGEQMPVAALHGWAEEVHNRW